MAGPKHAQARPATFGDLFAGSEFKSFYAATTLSWVGDYLARAAVTALVFRSTDSVVLSASSFAIGYLPSLTAGPILAALAERYPPRVAMVTCDVIRACLIAVLAVPGVPIPVLFILLFAAALLAPPFEASRSALMPRMLEGDRYVLALSTLSTTNSLTMVCGYFAGGLAAAVHPHLTLGIDAATFGISAVLILVGMTSRAAGLDASHRTGLLRETADGFRLVIGNTVLRSVILAVLGASLLVIVPEGLAAAWAAHLSKSNRDPGWYQALIMMSVPVGSVIAAIVVGRLLSAETRRRLIRPFAIAVPVALTFAFADPPAAGVAAIGAVMGFATTGMVVPANALYVRAMPSSYRARAFGVMQFATQLVQGVGLIVTGALADAYSLHIVVGAWGLLGLAIMIAVVVRWPSAARVGAVVDAAASPEGGSSGAPAVPRPGRRRVPRGAPHAAHRD